MKNRRGQFYLVAVLLIVTIFIGIISIENFARIQRNVVSGDLNVELSMEKMKVLDFLANTDSTDGNSEIILTNFSKTYIDKIGRNKNILFIIGKQTGAKIIGNSLNDSELSYSIGAESNTINKLGEFEISITPTDNNINISIDGNDYGFDLEKGQNLYYIIKHEYDNEVHIIRG